MRPRANTISHVDGSTLGLLAAANSSAARTKPKNGGHSHHPSLNGLSGPESNNFGVRGMSSNIDHHRPARGLPKIETNGLNIDLGGSLRTAPPMQGFPDEYGMEGMVFSPGNTINPAQLHFNDSPHSMPFDTPPSPFQHGFGFGPTPSTEDESTFDWISGFDNQMSFLDANEHAIAGSSPSAISTGSPGVSEAIADSTNEVCQSTAPWQPSMLSQSPMTADYYPDTSGQMFLGGLSGPLSPGMMDFTSNESPFQGNAQFSIQKPMTPTENIIHSNFVPSMAACTDTPTTAASIGSSHRHSSVTSISTDSITDATRQSLISSLSQPAAFNQRKYSQPSSQSPLPGFRTRSTGSIPLPSTYDLQRYVSAYVQYFHPHLPFLHISTLSFDSPAYSTNFWSSNGAQNHNTGIAGGGGCLILSMAAIGALYEFDHAASKELFDLAKRKIQLYLEERRKAEMTAAINGAPSSSENSENNTPLWLVQAMLLNVIYGHNCGDKTSADIASTHCAALVSLARAADLAKPFQHPFQHISPGTEDVCMTDDGWISRKPYDSVWHAWKLREERKRTLYAVFILSSMLVSAYNHSPALTNSEIRLDLPCDEELWAADSAEAWYAMDGPMLAESRCTTFSAALTSLITASQRQQFQQHQYSQSFYQSGNGFAPPELPMGEYQFSAFGCLVLINALHNYIWETRQRHSGRRWTAQETEAMHARIEPALAAWQAAWASNPHHSLERPNPYGLGPLSADSIPLLDLAYVRLFVNLGRSKEAFWHRDYDRMADEIARGSEIIQHAEYADDRPKSGDVSNDRKPSSASIHSIPEHQEYIDPAQLGQCSSRERHLKKAAFHAAQSLSMSDKLGVTFADFTSRELPIQSALCAFDCAQVLAEWVSTIQERVGKYLGLLGRDPIDFGAVPAIVLIDQEDVSLFEKIDHFLASTEAKMGVESNAIGGNNSTLSAGSLPSKLENCGYGSKVLTVTAHMLDKAAVWPGKDL